MGPNSDNIGVTVIRQKVIAAIQDVVTAKVPAEWATPLQEIIPSLIDYGVAVGIPQMEALLDSLLADDTHAFYAELIPRVGPDERIALMEEARQRSLAAVAADAKAREDSWTFFKNAIRIGASLLPLLL